MPVAKSYANLVIEEGPYTVNSRAYCKVRMKNGTLKQVRHYTENEYKRMYPDAEVPTASSARKTQRDILGFEKGYITIFKGDSHENLEWFKRSIARYCRLWGWYIVSTDEVPADLPSSVTPVVLPWESVGDPSGILKPDTAVNAAVEVLLYDPSPSEYVGSIGERLELELTVVKAIILDGAFGRSTMHIMEDANQNVFVWTTTAKSWTEGTQKRLRGTIKDHKIYKNTKQSILTRCQEVS